MAKQFGHDTQKQQQQQQQSKLSSSCCIDAMIESHNAARSGGVVGKGEKERDRVGERGREGKAKERERGVLLRSDGTSKLNKNNLSKCPSIEQIKLQQQLQLCLPPSLSLYIFSCTLKEDRYSKSLSMLRTKAAKQMKQLS